MILTLLPFLAFVVIYLGLLGRPKDFGSPDARDPFVGPLVAWGVLLALGMEVLSLFGAIAQAPLALMWSGVILGATLVGGGRSGLERGYRRLAAALGSLTPVERGFSAALAILSGLLFLQAVVSPPNNVDSVNAHMVQVVHWAQGQSLESSAGGLTRPPFAEEAILNLRVLFGGDRPAALAQWLSLMACVVVTTAVAAGLGANRAGQLVAAFYTASIPMAVLEASNTKNDLVVSLWVICVAYYAVQSALRRLAAHEVLLAGGAIGLGMLTKGTFQPAALPFVVWLAVNVVRKAKWKTGLATLAAIGVVAVLLNLGYWIRNVRSYGTPFGTVASLANALEIDDLLLPATPAATPAPVPTPGPTVEPAPRPTMQATTPPATEPQVWPLVSRAASLLTLHTIYPGVGPVLRGLMGQAEGLYPPGFLASLEEGMWNHEDSSGALLHMVLAFTASLWVVFRSLRARQGIPLVFVSAAWLGWCLLTLIANSIHLWGIRYQLGFLVLGSAIVGMAATWIPRRLALGLALVLLLSSFPYAFLNNTRPLVGVPPRTRSQSILTTPAVDLLFISTPEIQEQYTQAAQMLAASTCRQVVLDLGARDLEYTLWWLLDAPQSGFRLEAITQLAAVQSDGNFVPCALLCTRCADRYPDLPLLFDGGFIRLHAVDRELGSAGS